MQVRLYYLHIIVSAHDILGHLTKGPVILYKTVWEGGGCTFTWDLTKNEVSDGIQMGGGL